MSGEHVIHTQSCASLTRHPGGGHIACNVICGYHAGTVAIEKMLCHLLWDGDLLLRSEKRITSSDADGAFNSSCCYRTSCSSLSGPWKESKLWNIWRLFVKEVGRSREELPVLVCVRLRLPHSSEDLGSNPAALFGVFLFFPWLSGFPAGILGALSLVSFGPPDVGPTPPLQTRVLAPLGGGFLTVVFPPTASESCRLRILLAVSTVCSKTFHSCTTYPVSFHQSHAQHFTVSHFHTQEVATSNELLKHLYSFNPNLSRKPHDN
ncbi:uncharacterized protein LOC133503489 isoform X1 [Syngnathoides biaculeatus]|uniref:uncharacterized protein LOC133503489 isoform X1 n=1 Tax=Syngnathoides biaculeatus TaxID=300417 RepID=UPI002ADD7CB6|nr:uncharacterized protein LOC133503489 isoform X1 [Syngnathoides biaculeatus]